MCRLSLIAVLPVVLAFSTLSVAANQPPNDPQALAFVAKSSAFLTGGTPISDVVLTGNVARTLGSDTDTGTATFLAKGETESRVDLDLGGSKRSDVRNSSNGAPRGTWSIDGGKSVPYALHNCLTNNSWFFPALSSLSALDPNTVFSYVGLEKRGNFSVQHIRSYQYGAIPSAQLSTMDFYLDAATLLPIAITFNVHPDVDANINIPAEVDFSNYQLVNGLAVPLHVQQYLQGGLFLDAVFTNVVVNSGLPDSDFIIQ